MSAPLLTLSRGDSVTAWELSPTTAIYYPGTPAPARDPQNYHYINGFVDVGDLPCRVATWRDVATRTVALQTDWPVESLNLPGSNRRVEFTQFRYRPTRLSRWCRTRIAAPEDRYCSFRLTTCGAIHIWVDGVLAARFEPFTRNQAQETVVHLPIKAAGSEVIVLSEDMAERDTNWFFELSLVDQVRLDIFLPGAEVGEQAEALKALAAQVRCRGDVVSEDDDIVLIFDTAPSMDVEIEVTVASTSHGHANALNRRVTLKAGATEVFVCHGREVPDGYYNVPLMFSIGPSRVERVIGCAVLHALVPGDIPGDLAGRKQLALEHAARHGENRMGTVVALLETGRGDDPRIRPILEDTLQSIEERHDCADFVAVPLLWAYHRHAPDFPQDLRRRTETVLQGFRYWVDEPGNDVMWFWSENHALCFHVSQLLAGLAWPDAIFSASGRSGRQQAEVALERLGLWLDAVEEDGLAEWNSSAYYPVDFIGLLALAELAPEAISGRARGLCDRIFTMLALHTLNAVPAGSIGRAYDKELRAGPLTELAPFAAVAFGKGWLNSGVASLPLFAAGRYEPPTDLWRHAQPARGETISAQYRQGFGPAALLTLHKTEGIQLSTNSGARAGGYGHQQHVIDLRFASHPMARSWINHPGEDDPWGNQRPSYWAGNGNLPRVLQDGGTALVLYRLDADARLDFTHIYAARSGVEHHLDGDTLILKAGQALVGYKATSPLIPVTTGPGAGLEYRQIGRQQGWAVITANGQDLDQFKAQLAAMRLDLGDDGTCLVLGGPGRSDLRLNWTRSAEEEARIVQASAEPSITWRATP
ncbi:hypothetical protein [Devosia sp. 63-57]|uniref:hypothetical protein n=1 Tax=Devosia sp. 63-57 TaxID=1895751 RepID=UPI00086F2676|nr:hypothetical protein [Devosia sp. 63-57]ODT50160.1 MAG: hypothetical protein ABS74_04340 [Pelagibacterium sp. SCN 63-126]ODU87376.1 MAG: hypothetical protein ABT14_05210 [Pelagibacterium sp. SCN 63-17]OJX44902.1 MAG: hypothetical protein BGO80_03340 [Devosia sp. 63-57]